uniref:Reverse transcriptase domain, reverse transcriptase zinc-binding domain protein n=1 Tax=Tanacetum cinerariifolium TaxID=118510 RepID=A0A6L2KZG7_TANCI|nr:reverse transcriptase domain, reverse transcriptase zinc-binding domain protein [Tanacetum cinerariifolium]
MWKLNIEQYFQVQDYALWDVIENGNSFNPVPRITTNADGTSTSTISGPVTTEEKAQKKNDVKARSMLDATVYAFLENQPNRTQLVHEDLEQIHEDDLRRNRFKMAVSFAEYESKKVLPENRSPRNQESRPRNQDNSRKTVIVEDTFSKAMVAIDGAGFDWSYMADDKVPTNMALMAFSDSEVHNRKTCSNTCLKSFKTPKNQYDNLRIELNKSVFHLANYKRGLASIEEQLVFYKKNEVVFYDQIVVHKRDASFRELDIIALNLKIEKLKKEKECNRIKIDNFENASKSLDKLIGSQITDNRKTGLGFTSYNVVAPPPIGLFAPLTIDLSSSGLEEIKQLEFESYGPKASKSVCVDTSNVIKKASNAPIIEDWVSDCDEDESDEMIVKSKNV